ncbi:MAG TPA: NAD(P)-dependent oxidoreductase, partial [Vicinamibacterales bacterium]|nr:NAD(P)-dependent oxidoreductase [Vicinamibacterales bacterium]
EDAEMRVGFIGLGRMGRGMANRLLGGGHDLVVHDVVRAAGDEFVKAGATFADSVAALCAGRDVVVTMLVEDAQVIDIATRAGGLCASMAKGAIHLAMGTYGVGAIRALGEAHAKAGQVLVAAPVLGRPDLAASGQLGIVSGGPADAVTTVAPLLALMGRKTFHAGDLPESATAIKLANNMVLGCAMIAMGEGFSLIRRYGVAPQMFYDVMTEGLFASTAYKGYGKTMVDQTYDNVGSPITVGLKDAKLIQDAADLARVPMPMHNIYKDRLLGAVAHGDGDRDQAVLAREQARAAGLESS